MAETIASVDRAWWSQRFDRVKASYTDRSRHYHDARHIADCLATLDAASLAGIVPLRPIELELAIWLHDLIYNTHADDNEARSAEAARMLLRRAGLTDASVARVAHLIQATDHALLSQADDEHTDGVPPSGAYASDIDLICDIDLAGLAAEPDAFDAAGQAIRREYAWVPADRYIAGRCALLQGFLDRSSVYRTPWFRERYEDAARGNLRRAIALLRGGTGV